MTNVYNSVFSFNLIMIMTKKRLNAITIMKALAVIFIINHRLQISYGDFSILATGGAIGCAFFFFISGYTSAMNENTPVISKIGRLFPSLWVLSILYMIMNVPVSWQNFILAKGFWFIQCIILYYIAFFFIKRYLSKCLSVIFYIYLLFCILFTILINGYEYSMYGDNYLKYILFFCFFLMGAKTQKELDLDKLSHPQRFKTFFVITIASVIIFYAIMFLQRCSSLQWMQIFTLAILLILVYSIFRYLLSFDIYKGEATILIKICTFISACSLEVYLIQTLFTPILEHKLVFLFPLNIVMMMIFVILQAYVLKNITKYAFNIMIIKS